MRLQPGACKPTQGRFRKEGMTTIAQSSGNTGSDIPTGAGLRDDFERHLRFTLARD
jgi:hypothetical protein